MSATTGQPAANGHDDHDAAPTAGPMAQLRTTPENVHLLRGYGPLVAGIVLFLLMVTLAPTVAPERTVERPVEDPAATTTVAEPGPGDGAEGSP